MPCSGLCVELLFLDEEGGYRMMGRDREGRDEDRGPVGVFAWEWSGGRVFFLFYLHI